MQTSSTVRTRDRTALAAGEVRNGEDLAFTVLENGAIFTITHRDIQINLFSGNPMDGGVGNIYIRRHHDQGIASFPVLGPAANSRFGIGNRAARWEGSRSGLDYRCDLGLAAGQSMWFWTIYLHNTAAEPQVVDAVLSQDLGLAAPTAIRANELYTSQYIDHAVYDSDDYGYVVCSRQNQEQGGRFPWIMHGCLNGAAGYLTDGFQFFGLRYRETNIPAALAMRDLPNRNYQYEFALPTLSARPLELPPGATADITFFAVYVADHPEATLEQDLEQARAAERTFHDLHGTIDTGPAGTRAPESPSLFSSAPLFSAQALSPGDVDRYFGAARQHEEEQNGSLLSFFHGPHHHVVLKDKELLCERPHGHILRSGREITPDDETLSLTCWMDGVFLSHLTIGNTNFNKLLTVARNPLNVLKSIGTRIFVKRASGYALLGLPSAFEMGLNVARWIYQGDGAVIVVKVWTSPCDPACFLEITVEGPDALEFAICHNVVLGDAEYETRAAVEIDDRRKRAELIPAPTELIAQTYPEARFFIASCDIDAVERVDGDGLLFPDGLNRDYPYLVFKTTPIKRCTLTLTGNVLSGRRAAELADTYAGRPDDYAETQRETDEFWRGLRKTSTLELGRSDPAVSKLNDILPWYAHNAMIHFTTPYGLEQFSGAAWGTRDVCQGPVEFLLATRNFEAVKQALRTVYRHQLDDTGDWPQWFMFDRYWAIAAPDSHADIVIWPLKALCAYIEATDDLALLEEEIAYTDGATGSITAEAASIFDHTVRQIERMEQGFVQGTALIGYGHGDWEDTLQPADPAVRRRWVSPWTVELMYQTLGDYARVCSRAGKREIAERLVALCGRIKDDFNKYLVKDGTVAGLAELNADGVTYLLHPADERTGVRYRLLPMTRGMLSGMFTPEQMQRHLAIIDQHLKFPDGVRLMDRPVEYHGGTEHLFKRAETAANFGREIGLQYIHAHIRYIEAMCLVGRPEEAFEALLEIIPIGIQDVVPSALPRQSNAYFSSSDAAFDDRYDAREHFGRISSLEVGVKGGWRIYSSGPGLVIAELVTHILGLRERFSDVLLDPVLPARLNGLMFDFEYAGKLVRYVYRIGGDGFSPRRVVVNGVELAGTRDAGNPYRRGGLLLPKTDFIRALNREENEVEIHI